MQDLFLDLVDQLRATTLFKHISPLLYSSCLVIVFMFIDEEAIVSICIEGFFYGLYSGIFAVYLQCPPNADKSRTATILFYSLCLLYALSTISIASDLASIMITLELSFSSLSPQLQNDLQPTLFYIYVVQTTVSGCCDFIAQCIIIYRCWIVWGQNIRVVIVPSFLAVAYLVLWIAIVPSITVVDGAFFGPDWGNALILTSLVASMAVNTLVTGLIVFRILKVFLEVKATTVERALGSTGGTTLQHIIFVIIESGMALFAIQLVRVVFFVLPSVSYDAGNFVIVINEMFNGIAPTIILVRVSMKLSFDNKESFMEAAGSLCFNNPPSDLNTRQRVGSSTSNMPPQERNEVV